MNPPVQETMADHGTENIRQARSDIVQRHFPGGIPKLWCPALTHFSRQGCLDEVRTRYHWQHISPYVKGVLVPGSTGEGWEMTDDDIRRLLETVLDIGQEMNMRMLIGVLKTDLASMLECIDTTLAFLRHRTGASAADEALLRSNVAGFTVCPPKGSQLSQSALADALTAVADRGVPLAFYQLPQVTGNELAAETIQTLAARIPGFYLFKDTSGNDLVARSSLDLHGIFLVRGAEGDYHRWLTNADGPYNGFLLSSSNVFAEQLTAIRSMQDEGQAHAAAALSKRIGKVIEECFRLVKGFPAGNAFANANKVLDHIMAFGEECLHRDPPLLYSGVRLPVEFIEHAAGLLRQEELFPARGYIA
jgi:dihydrodipicolinate synthase/N-acetylneuraminate lyase